MRLLLIVLAGAFVSGPITAQAHSGASLPDNAKFCWFKAGPTEDGTISTGGGGDVYHADDPSGTGSGSWSLQKEGGCYRQLTGWSPGQDQFVYVFTDTSEGEGKCFSWIRYKVKTGPSGTLSIQPSDWQQDGTGWACGY